VKRPALVVVVASGLACVAGGCFGGAASPRPTGSHPESTTPVRARPYARFVVRGVYASRAGRQNHLFGPGVRRRFTVTCRAPERRRDRARPASWETRLCAALIDYRTAPRSSTGCFCPFTTFNVVVRGEVRGRRIREAFSACVCGLGRRARRDTLIILRTRPPRGYRAA
jgi:hypothetical protein